MAAPKRTTKKPSQGDRIDHLETGMTQLSAGITAILDRMDQQDEAKQSEPEATKPEVEQKKTEVIELPPSHISLGEIKMRRDLAEYLLNRVDALDKSRIRPGWTVERELEQMVKHSKKSAEHAQAAEESRSQTISGDQRV